MEFVDSNGNLDLYNNSAVTPTGPPLDSAAADSNSPVVSFLAYYDINNNSTIFDLHQNGDVFEISGSTRKQIDFGVTQIFLGPGYPYSGGANSTLYCKTGTGGLHAFYYYGRVAAYGVPTWTLTGVDNPAALVCSPSGNLYVANQGNNTVSEFASSAQRRSLH